jgi:hypothetical protein
MILALRMLYQRQISGWSPVVTRRQAVLRANSSMTSALHSRQLFSAELEDVDGAHLQVLPEALAGWCIIDNADARKLMLALV